MPHILQAVQQEAAELTAIRRRCHEHPELSRQETQTMAYIQEKLTEYGIASRHVEHGGILGWIDGQKPGKTLLLRADIDALPIEESLPDLPPEMACALLLSENVRVDRRNRSICLRFSTINSDR